MRKKDKTNLFKVGVFITGLTTVVVIMVMSIGKENSIFESKVDIKAKVENVANLKRGSYIELKGIRVGTVSDINIIADDEVQITMRILKSQLKWIKSDSKIAISTAGLVGDKYIEIYNGSKDSPKFNPEKDILLSEGMTNLKQIMSKGESIATTTERILGRVDQILVRLGDQTADSIQKSTKNLEILTHDLKEAKIGEMVKNVNKTTASMARIMDQVEHGQGTVNSLLYDDGLYDDLRVLLGGAQRNKVIKYFIRESIKNAEKKKD